MAHDRVCCPDALLTPYFIWISRKWFEWTRLKPTQAQHGAVEERQFEDWLDRLDPSLDAVTCECHVKLFPRRR
jgi:hypothetical protein